MSRLPLLKMSSLLSLKYDILGSLHIIHFRALMKKWVSHAEISNKSIQIHLSSKMCSTHLTITLSFSYSWSCQLHIIFPVLPMMPSSGMLLCIYNYPYSCNWRLLWILLEGIFHQRTTAIIFKPNMRIFNILLSCFNDRSPIFLSAVYSSSQSEK